ncbi:MAG: hypothetical protein FD161_1655 [Limisphaerales bacterium]|nr:MAG: hypothetical protein FD161_1655 [Limisphaerales bacterium]KAG0509264.1 MAG: hypothetical protein E1N63_1574 [Limisphaerales bacterium]TXT52197.1 MAG: hypothetical protein FD140_940 [Limisphaerales bacterium]
MPTTKDWADLRKRVRARITQRRQATLARVETTNRH